MKSLFRYFLINLVSLWITTEVITGLYYTGGFRILLIGAGIFTLINIILVPLIKILLLPLNILTLGFFAWLTNVIALYALTTIVPYFKLRPFIFPGYELNGFIIPGTELSVLWVAIIASILIGLITHILHWLIH
jgi:putative membrane protein